MRYLSGATLLATTTIAFALTLTTTTTEAQCPPTYVKTGTSAGDSFGSAVAFVGDVNNDGFDDYAVGAPLAPSAGAAEGEVTVYSGLDGSVIWALSGFGLSSRFGISVGAAGDLNGDGFADIVIGAPGDDNECAGCGMAFVVSGISGTVYHTLSGVNSPSDFGSAVKSIPDINGDLVDDFLVGAPLDGASSEGTLYFFSGAVGFVYDSIVGSDPAGEYGATIAIVGDINGDLVFDFAVGAPAGGPNSEGRVIVYSGADNAVLYDKVGDNFGDRFGGSLAGAGDVDNDGTPDFIIGEPNFSIGIANRGRVRVYSGSTGLIIHTVLGQQSGAQMGKSVTGLGDINGDGFNDLAVSAWQSSLGGAESGAVFIFDGQTGAKLSTIVGKAGDKLGSALSGRGDIDNDGINDLVIGAANAPGTLKGVAQVYTMPPDHCFNSVWEASSGLFPEQLCPPGELFDNSKAFDPVFVGDTLVLRTSTDLENMSYWMSAPSFTPPDTFVAETRLRYVSGSSSSINRAPVSMAFVVATDIGQLLNIGKDTVFIMATATTRGQTAVVDTDDNFHSYRIEIYLTDSVMIYYDDSLLLKGTTYSSAANFAGPSRVIWGEGSSLATGESRWLNFKHNGFSGTDTDADLVFDACDNCPFTFNPLQEDFDSDGFGDSCFLPSYLTPLTIVAREAAAPSPSGFERGGAVGDPEVNLRVTDPDGLFIEADPSGVISNTIGEDANYYEVNAEDSVVIDNPKTGEYLIEVFAKDGVDPSKYYELNIRIDGTVGSTTDPKIAPIEGVGVDTAFVDNVPYAFGDANGNRTTNIADAIFIINMVFNDGPLPPVPEAADANCNGTVNIADAIYIINTVFNSGPAPGCN